MNPHDRWLELAALDAIGELTAEEQQELRAHLRECAECRATAAARAASAEERERRDAFLAHGRSEGLQFSAAAACEPRPWLVWIGGWNTAPAGAALAAVVLALAGVALWWDRPGAR